MTQKKFVFTNRTLHALAAHDPNSASKATEYSDQTVAGLKMIVGTGSKRFAFRYQTVGGRKRYAPLGTFPAIDVAEARRLALEMRAIVDRGGDPLEDRDRVKAMPTFREFVRQEYLPYAYQAKPGSAHDDESKFRLHLEPKWGNLRLCDVTTRDVQMHHAAMRQSHSAGTANRHLALISATFRKALEWGRVDRNPAAGVKAFREENQRQRFLTSDEIGRLFAAMEAEPNQTAVSALKLALYTGARREEVLQARWEHVDLQGGQWWLPKTKNGRGRYIALSDEAEALLTAQPSLGTSPWVFPGRFGDKPLNNPRKAFCRVLAAAGVEHLRIHDLRHSFASLAVNAGATLYEVQDLLGHSSSAMTMRYAHLADAGRKRVVGKVGAVVTAAVQAAGDEKDKAA